MSEDNPYDDFKDADPEQRKLIRKLLWRRELHRWFDHFMEFLGTVTGAAVSVLAIYLSYKLIASGDWVKSAGGSVLGGSNAIALARTFVFSHKVNAITAKKAQKPAKRKR